MKPLMRWALLSAGMVLLIFGVSAAAGKPPVGRTKEVMRSVQTVAMNGVEVAYSTGDGVFSGPGDKVYVWNVRTGKGRLVSGHNPDPVYEVAISSKGVAWIARGGTASDPTAEINESLFSGSLGKPSQPESLDSAFRTESESVPDFPGGCDGDWIGGLVGSRNVLAVNRWTTVTPGSVVTAAELDLVTPSGLRRKISSANSLVAQSTDGTHIAVLQSRDAWPYAGSLCGTAAAATVRIYAPTGKLIAHLNVAGAKELALSGNNLAVLTRGEHDRGVPLADRTARPQLACPASPLRSPRGCLRADRRLLRLLAWSQSPPAASSDRQGPAAHQGLGPAAQLRSWG